MANNAKLKAAGIDPVIQSYGDTWTSQLFVLADFHNVTAEQPDWADQVHRKRGAIRRRAGAIQASSASQEVKTRPAT